MIRFSLTFARRCFFWHKWSSLICTVFILLLCITGLPLIFHHEIEDGFFHVHKEAADPKDFLNLDELIISAKKVFPKKNIHFIGTTSDKPDISIIGMAESAKAPLSAYTYLSLNRSTGKSEVFVEKKDFMYYMRHLHIDLFAGIAGKCFLGLMGILFVISIISGALLYGPFMKKYDFGMIRKHQKRKKWLDLHNLTGIVLLVWMTVIGLTGIINAFSEIIIGVWQLKELSKMNNLTQHNENVSPQHYISLDSVSQIAAARHPAMHPLIISYPETFFAPKNHFSVFLHGKTPLTKNIYNMVLIHADDGKIIASEKMPWYVNTLFLSQPLHFGDYGGIPLKIIWALLDIICIVVLISGLRLWWQRLEFGKKIKRKQINELNT